MQYLVVRSYRTTRKFYRKHFANPDNITRSERRKQQTLKKLDNLLEDATSQEYHKQVVSLADTEIPSEEYLPFAKRKQRYLLAEIAKLQDKPHLTAAEKLQVEALETRLRLHNETYNARLEREKKANQRVGLIQRYISKFIFSIAFAMFFVVTHFHSLCSCFQPTQKSRWKQPPTSHSWTDSASTFAT